MSLVLADNLTYRAACLGLRLLNLIGSEMEHCLDLEASAPAGCVCREILDQPRQFPISGVLYSMMEYELNVTKAN
jgi:hypothetical protein